MTFGPTPGLLAPATLPPERLPELDPSWSRLVTATDADGIDRTWHVLDSGTVAPHAAGDGSGEAERGTLLCVHGNPTWSYLWRDLLAATPAGWRVVAIDHLDMGFSQRTGTVRPLQRRIDDLSVLTDALSLDGPVVSVAHDWGGPISLGWALRHVDRLAGMILFNTAVHQPAAANAPRVIRMARMPGVLEAVCVQTPAFVRSATALARPRLSRAERDAFAAPYASAARRQAIGAFVRDIPLEADHPSAGTLDAIAHGLDALAKVPVLLVWGSKDPVFSDRYLHDLQQRLPHAEVHRHGRASHLVTEDIDLATTVERWLTHLRTTDATSAPPDLGTHGRRTPLWARLEDPAHHGQAAIVQIPTGGSGLDGRSSSPTMLTFERLADDVRSLAASMTARGVRPGDRVALLVPPGADLATALYACWRMGAVVVVADAGLGARGITQALKSAAPDYLIGIPKALAAARALRWPGRPIAVGDLSDRAVRALGARVTLAALVRSGRSLPAPPTPDADAEAAVVFTSGATGPAKGVVYRHRQIEAQRDALIETYAITSDDRLVAAFAPFALFGPLMGITSVVPDMDVTSPRTLRAAALADAAAAVDATLVFASPAALTNVLATGGGLDADQGQALARVRLLLSAGAPVPTELLRGLRSLLPEAEAHTPYGMTEALPVADIDLAGIEAAGMGNGVCVGHPIRGVEVAVSPLDGDGAATGPLTTDPEVTGEICVRAAHVKDRYDRLWLTEQASARNPGWHRSGDVGHLDVDGRIWVEGRLIHIITTTHGVVTPVAIEQRVERLDEVAAAGAVGVGPAGTQQIVVVVAPAAGGAAGRRGGLADQVLTEAVRRAAGVDLAAVLVAPALPVDIRHNSKIDRAKMAAWADNLLAGSRAGRL